jgi:amidase
VDVEESTIAQLLADLDRGRCTAGELVRAYLQRIATLDRSGPTLRSVIEVNPDAVDIAAALDRDRAGGVGRGPLHGIPILLKDNIDTADRMQTTAGSLALVGAAVNADAAVARKLRAAGAIILGKTNLSEWANFRSSRSSSGWSGRGRQTRNPYVLDRTPSGSSSGSAVAVAANLCAATLGTETDGSIISPSSACGVVGIKPTVGLTSRDGVIPISHSQDTVGPHARTVADAAAMLSAIAESGIDYRQFINANGLRGARIGVAREFHTGYSEHTDRVFEQTLETLRLAGADLVDQVFIPGEAELRERSLDNESSEGLVLEYEFKAGLAAYLANRPEAQIRSLADLIRFNLDHAADEMPYFQQERLVKSDARGPLTDAAYLEALSKHREFARRFTALFEEQRLDALVAPSNPPACVIDLLDGDHDLGGSTQPAAVAGFPVVTVPAGFACDCLPLGLSFMGPAFSEPILIKLASGFESTTAIRRRPTLLPTFDPV